MDVRNLVTDVHEELLDVRKQGWNIQNSIPHVPKQLLKEHKLRTDVHEEIPDVRRLVVNIRTLLAKKQKLSANRTCLRVRLLFLVGQIRRRGLHLLLGQQVVDRLRDAAVRQD